METTKFKPSQLLGASILIVLVCLCLSATSQELKRPLGLPMVYENPKEDVLDGKYRKEKLLPSKRWVVWVDRTGIRTSTGVELEFMQKCWVIDQREEEIRVAEYNPEVYNFILDEFTSQPKDLGWVKKKDMLLWSEGLSSNDRGFRIKVMTITTPAKLKIQIDEGMGLFDEGAKKLAFRNDPYAVELNGRDSPLFEIFYVYKKENGKYLLAKVPNITSGKAKDYVYGWVDENAVIFWRQRQSLEPNWQPPAISERKSFDIQPAVFEFDTQASDFAEQRIVHSSALWIDPYTKRKVADWKRFPIFEKNGNIVKTGLVSGIFSGSSAKKVELSSEEFAVLSKMYNDQRSRSRKINIVFVIDATKSMGPYIQATKRAVTNSIRKLDNASTENEFSYGFVAYRDFSEGDKLSDAKPLSKNPSQILSNISDISAFHLNDADQKEAVYTGLSKGVDLFREKTNAEYETNIIILIGDTGSHENLEEMRALDKLKQICLDYQVSILAIQASNLKGDAHEEFVFQMRDLINKSVRLSLSKINTELQDVRQYPDKPSMKKIASTAYRLDLDDAPILGGIQYARRGTSIDPEKTSELIQNLIQDLDRGNDSLLNLMEDFMNSVKFNSGEGTLTPAMAAFLIKAGFSKGQIATLLATRYQFLFETYLPIEISILKNELFAYVLFLDQDELDGLILTLQKLIGEDRNASKQRSQLADIWREELKTNYGVTEKELKGETIGRLLSLVTDLPTQSPLLAKYRLDDFIDLAKMNDQEFRAVKNLIRLKYRQLQSISGEGDSFFRSNDRKFYWVPYNYLP